MNKCVFLGRTTKDLDVRVSAGQNQMSIGRTSLAVNSGYGDKKRTDFINLVIFGKSAENFEKFVKKGNQVVVECHVQTGSYTNKDGQKVNTTDFIVDNFHLIEKANATTNNSAPSSNDGFIDIPDGIESELPFQ